METNNKNNEYDTAQLKIVCITLLISLSILTFLIFGLTGYYIEHEELKFKNKELELKNEIEKLKLKQINNE